MSSIRMCSVNTDGSVFLTIITWIFSNFHSTADKSSHYPVSEHQLPCDNKGKTQAWEKASSRKSSLWSQQSVRVCAPLSLDSTDKLKLRGGWGLGCHYLLMTEAKWGKAVMFTNPLSVPNLSICHPKQPPSCSLPLSCKQMMFLFDLFFRTSGWTASK